MWWCPCGGVVVPGLLPRAGKARLDVLSRGCAAAGNPPGGYVVMRRRSGRAGRVLAAFPATATGTRPMM